MTDTPFSKALRAEKRALPLTFLVFIGLLIWAALAPPGETPKQARDRFGDFMGDVR